MEGEGFDVPTYFLCPISLQIMRDPVTLSTGITYDRHSIERWIFSNKQTSCPATGQTLTNADLTPNHTLRRLIQSWCVANASNGIDHFPTPHPPVDKARIASLLADAMMPHLRLDSLCKLKSIISESDRNKRCVEASGFLDFLASIVKYESLESEEALAILVNLQISEQGLLHLIEKNDDAIESLTLILHRSSYQSRIYATLLLKSLISVLAPERLMGLRHELFQGLVKVLKDGISYQAMKAALQVLSAVCPWGRNRIKAVNVGAVAVIIEILINEHEKRPTEMLLAKIAFGHFPLSFSAATDTGKNLKDIFLKHSISAYLCGHLHTKFGKNLKRHHLSGHHSPISGRYYQYNIHEGTQIGADGENCSNEYVPTSEFWEWEMGDWRQSRAMRILAIDSGHVSFLDVDFRMGLKRTIIMPTFPVDSRFMQRASSPHYFKCQTTKASSYDTVRVLIFSRAVIASVTVKIYDSRPGNLNLVLESPMKKLEGNETRGDLYTVPWNWRAFVDPSPDRYWLQIEAIDISGTSTYSKITPFSINGLTARVSWKWKEFFVMGCQWASLYRPILWSSLFCIFTLLLIPHALCICSKRQYTYKNISPSFSGRKVVECLVDGTFWVLMELSKMTVIWWSVLLYIIYLIFFPWFSGHVFTESGKVAYMTHEGWAVARSSGSGKSVVGVPDVMVVVLPHICFVVLPTLLVVAVMAAEKTAYRIHYLSLSGKKEDDQNKEKKRHVKHAIFSKERFWSGRWLRKFVLLLCLAIFWKHWKQCRALVKAYEMNPFRDSLIFCFWTPMLLVYAIYKTGTD